MKLDTIAKKLTALQKAVNSLEKLKIVQLPKKDCLKLLDTIEEEKLYTVKEKIFDPDRARKVEDKDAKYYVGYLGDETPENCTAIVVVNFSRPSTGFMYINQIVGVMRGYGFKTLKKLIDKFKQYKIWLMVSPKYNKESQSFVENTKLNSQYRKNLPSLKEVSVDNVELGPKCNCRVSWFYTLNCRNEIADMVKSGNYYGIK